MPFMLHVSTHQRGHHQASINEYKNVLHKQLLCQRDPVGVPIVYVQTFLDSLMLA
jgi:hypothetical protein